VRYGKSRIIFCPNQITVSIAIGLARRDSNLIDTTIIYWPDRCEVSSLQAIRVTCIPYSRMACLLYLLKNIWLRRIEVVLPHRKLGNIVNWFSNFCSITALIDDGLDTFKLVPRNLCPDLFDKGTSFYTFRYEVMLGQWLNKFNVISVSDLTECANIARPKLDLAITSRLIIDSPPLDRVQSKIGLSEIGSILVLHSNINKRVIKNFSSCSVSGSEIAIEKSLESFTGELVVGESMVAVYALLQPNRRYRVVAYLSKENSQNLLPLVSLFNKKDDARIIWC
jgi:hypothetical protein